MENIFGPKIAQIVDGLTKISGGIFGEQASAQAENFKKLLLTMSDDIRVNDLPAYQRERYPTIQEGETVRFVDEEGPNK